MERANLGGERYAGESKKLEGGGGVEGEERGMID